MGTGKLCRKNSLHKSYNHNIWSWLRTSNCISFGNKRIFRWVPHWSFVGYKRLCSFYTRAGGRITARIAWYDEGRIDWTATLVVRHSHSDCNWLMDTSFLQKSIFVYTGIYSFVGTPRFRRANTAFYSKQYYSRRACLLYTSDAADE